MTTHFIADMHFGAERLARARGFADAAAMDAAIAAAWRERVGPHDTVWIVGDVGEAALLGSLPGIKHLVLGNTDVPVRAWRNCPAIGRVERAVTIDTGAGPLHLVHRPEDASPTDPRPVIHGHIHAKTWPDAGFLCVSVDQTGWGPITLDEVLRRLGQVP